MAIDLLSSQPALRNIETTNITGHKERIDRYENQSMQENSFAPSKEQVMGMIDGVNEGLKSETTHIKFELHEKLNEYYVTVVDTITNEVIKEIPAKKWLDLYADMVEFVGLFVDQKR